MMNNGANDANALWTAYLRTVYSVAIDGTNVRIRADETTPDLDAELTRRCVSTWAFITAWNPGSRQLSRAENAARHDELKMGLLKRRFTFVEGEGCGPDGIWAPELSLLVFDISEADASIVGQRHGQLAIVVGRLGAKARVVATSERAWFAR